MTNWIRGAVSQDESGHALAGLASLVGAAGAIVLAIGAMNDNDATTIIGGIVLAAGVLGAGLLEHITIDYGIFERLTKLEGEKK
jgi:hypothetical protein